MFWHYFLLFESSSLSIFGIRMNSSNTFEKYDRGVWKYWVSVWPNRIYLSGTLQVACLVTLQKKVVCAWWNFPAKWLTICHLIHTKSLLKKQLCGFIVRIHKILVWKIVKCFTGSFSPSINLFNSEECSIY